MGKIVTLIQQNALICIVFVFSVFVAAALTLEAGKSVTITIPQSAIAPGASGSAEITYMGVTGKNALSLLKEHAVVRQNPSGLVTQVNTTVANKSLHEYWAFYVNGKRSTIMPWKYQTKNGELIKWKIDRN